MSQLPPGVEALTLPLVIVSADRPAFTVEQMHAAHAAGARAGYLAGLEAAQELLSDALQSDLEHGVKWLNENAAKEFEECYPQLFQLAAAIRQLKDKQ